MKEQLGSQKGFTLLELMVAMSIFSILIIAVYGTFFSEYSRMNRQLNSAIINGEATRAFRNIRAVTELYGELTVSNSRLSSEGEIIIDCDSDDDLEGLALNLDNSTHQLLNSKGEVIADYVKYISFYLGPDSHDNVAITSDVVMVVIEMESGDMTFELKGGINIAR